MTPPAGPRHGEPEPLLRRIADHLGTLTGGTGWVVRVDEAARSWAIAVGDGSVPGEAIARMLTTGEPVVDGPVLAVPVRRGPRIVGACVASAGHAAGSGVSDADVHLAELFADYAALALADTGVLAGRTLEHAVRQELDWVEAHACTRADLVTVGAASIPEGLGDEVFRMTQEALLNAAVHADAACVRVGVVHGPGTLTVLVEDDGRGFDTAASAPLPVATAGARLGLRAVAARARRLDGELEIDSAPGRGTRLRLTLPCTSAPPPVPGRTRTGVLVAAVRPVVRAGVVRMLQLGAPDLGMVSEVSGADDLAAACRLLGPDVLVVEHDLLGDDLVGMLERLAAQPDPPAVVLLADDCPDERLRVAVGAGVKGCVDPDADRLVAVVAAAGRGETLLADDQLERLAAPARGTHAITPREREVRGLVARGLTDRQIGRALAISAKTVEKHVGSLLRKTGTRNRTMLAQLG
ncbi:LuxR C-terminal-related transcriptional regulator [Actinomycetospora straminea]|uniref:LuxR C-terminal-related transcriptional regulator n=1 Tax=Actinomycetospora straminea TaxID=663607 RepID=UPI0023671B1E|nr:ATP-binding protein [Actinomycetospora straminea]MDD7935386.1 LuxR C-terminal-related transcriptional regulator [Actinomycetospora straminea]